MSTAARKARKRARVAFERTPKVATTSYETRAQAQERRREERKSERAQKSVLGSIVASAARRYRGQR